MLLIARRDEDIRKKEEYDQGNTDDDGESDPTAPVRPWRGADSSVAFIPTAKGQFVYRTVERWMGSTGMRCGTYQLRRITPMAITGWSGLMVDGGRPVVSTQIDSRDRGIEVTSEEEMRREISTTNEPKRTNRPRKVAADSRKTMKSGDGWMAWALM